jgi:hypothetical protein
MAGAGYNLFTTGSVLTAAQVNTFLQEQTVMRFANATARTTALSGVLAEGMMSYLDDTNSVEVYNGSAWVSVGSTGDITGVTAGTGISGGGTSGDVTITNSMATAIDAKGDLVVGTGADAFSRLAAGTNGFTLVADSAQSTGLKWAAQPNAIGALVADTTNNITIPNNTTTVLNFPNEIYDTSDFHSTSTNTSRLTIPSGLGGYYYIYGWGMWTNTNTTSISLLRIRLNGGTADIAEARVPKRVTDWTSMFAYTSRFLSAGDYVELLAYQDSGSNMPWATGTSYGGFGIYRIGA